MLSFHDKLVTFVVFNQKFGYYNRARKLTKFAKLCLQLLEMHLKLLDQTYVEIDQLIYLWGIR